MKYVTQQFIHHIKEVAEASSNKTMNTLKEQTKGMNSTNAILWYIMNREKVLERYEKTIFDGLNFDIRDISEFVFQDTLEDKIYIVFSLNFVLNKIDAEIERLEMRNPKG